MNIARYFLKILIRINQKRLIPSLEKVSRPKMPAIIMGGIRNTEVPHELLQIGKRSFHQQVEVIRHKNISKNIHLVNVA
jgi:hypothetical protein